MYLMRELPIRSSLVRVHLKERMCAGYKVCVSVTPLAEVLYYPPAGGAGQQHYTRNVGLHSC